MQFELKFNHHKAKQYGTQYGRSTVTYTFDEVNGVGITVFGHEDFNDEEGGRQDIVRLDDKSCAYTVYAEQTIRVLLSVRPGATAMLLTPVLVCNGGEETLPAFTLNAGELYQLPQNIEMDAGEDQNVWILRNQHGEVVVKIMIRV